MDDECQRAVSGSVEQNSTLHDIFHGDHDTSGLEVEVNDEFQGSQLGGSAENESDHDSEGDDVEERSQRAEDVELDAGGFTKYNVRTVGDLSDGEAEELWADAGFVEGVTPEAWEKRLLQGSTFNDWGEFDRALNEYEALSGYRFRRLAKKKDLAQGVCRDWEKGSEHACKAKYAARRMKRTGLITIRKVFLIHTCPTRIHQFRSGSNKTVWVASKIYNQVRINPNTPINQLTEAMQTNHEAATARWTAQKARSACRERIAGGTLESFGLIPAYIDHLKTIDPDGHSVYQTGEGLRFSRLYISPSSSMNAAKHCRRIVGLDGTHTSGRYPMILLLATCFDAENHIVILAWGIVSVENGDNWTWFLEHLYLSFPTFRTPHMVFISDRDKGLKLGVADAFPNSHHAHCVQHLRTNIKGNIDVACSKYFKQIVEAKIMLDFERLITDFQPTIEKQAKFTNYIRKIDPAAYARHAFPARRYGHYTSNVVEIMNSAVKPGRALPALLLSDFLWCYIMEKHCERAEEANRLPHTDYAVTQYANNMLCHLHRESQGVRERRSDDNQSLMLDNKGSWVVRINEQYCDCLDWQEFEFPCIHALKCFANRSQDGTQAIGEVWRASTLRDTYSVPVLPLSMDRLPQPQRLCHAPLPRPKKKGMQSAKRKPSWGEQQARNSERLIMKQIHKCGRCQRTGHNARSCAYEPPLSSQHTGTASNSGVGAQHPMLSSHETIRVGDATAAQRPTTDHSWNLFHARSTTMSYSDFIAERDANFGTGSSQVIN